MFLSRPSLLFIVGFVYLPSKMILGIYNAFMDINKYGWKYDIILFGPDIETSAAKTGCSFLWTTHVLIWSEFQLHCTSKPEA